MKKTLLIIYNHPKIIYCQIEKIYENTDLLTVSTNYLIRYYPDFDDFFVIAPYSKEKQIIQYCNENMNNNLIKDACSNIKYINKPNIIKSLDLDHLNDLNQPIIYNELNMTSYSTSILVQKIH
ncbi:MAG: hypothetical protein ACK5HS_03480 [Mycoplasmatales bacterium]